MTGNRTAFIWNRDFVIVNVFVTSNVALLSIKYSFLKTVLLEWLNSVFMSVWLNGIFMCACMRLSALNIWDLKLFRIFKYKKSKETKPWNE